MIEASISRGAARQAARFLLLSLAKAAGGIFIIALNVLLVRFLPPEDFGRYAFCITIILLADSIIGGPFDLAVVKLCGEKRGMADEASTEATRAGLHLKLALVLLLGPLAAFAFEGSAARGGDTRLVIATVCAILAVLLLRSVLVVLQVTGRIAAYSTTEGIQLAMRIGLVVAVLAIFSPRGDLVLWALAAGSLAAALAGGLLFAPRLFGLAGLRALPHAPVASAAVWYLATIGLGAVIGRLDVIAMGWTGMTIQLGLFSAGQVIASIPELLGSYLAVFITPLLVAAMRDGTLRNLHDRLQPLLLAVAVTGLVLARLIWPPIATLLLPPDYAISGTIVLILLPGTLAAMATIPLALPMVMIKRRHALVVFDALLFPIVVAAYLLVVPEHGATGAAWVSCATTLLRSAYVLIQAFRITRASPIEQGTPDTR